MQKKKSFWRKSKENIVAKKEKKNAGDDDPVIIDKVQTLHEIQSRSIEIIGHVKDFVDGAREYTTSLSEASQAFLAAFPDGNEQHPIVLNSAKNAHRTPDIEFNLSNAIIQSNIIDPLEGLKKDSTNLLNLAEERDKARILMKRSDVTLEEMKTKKDDKKLLEKMEKNRIRHEDFTYLNQQFLDQSGPFLASYVNTFDKAFASFHFFVGAFTHFMKRTIFDDKGKFPYDELGRYLQPITVEITDIPEELKAV